MMLYDFVKAAIKKAKIAHINQGSPRVLDLLEQLIDRYTKDEKSLKKALRFFLIEQSAAIADHFSNEHLYLLFTQMAEEIVEANEPIITLLLPELDERQMYVDENFLPITIQAFTEELKDKRRLKNLHDFILSDDGKRLISCFATCRAAMRVNRGAIFRDQQGIVLSDAEQARLMRWDLELVTACCDYLNQKEPLWVTARFYKAHQDIPRNTLFFAMKLLMECLYNGGISRQGIDCENFDEDKIAQIGIECFYHVWFSLPLTTRLEWEAKEIQVEYEPGQVDHYIFGGLLYRMFSAHIAHELPDNSSYALSIHKDYVNFCCVETIAERFSQIAIQFENDLKAITLQIPDAPIIIGTEFRSKKFKQKRIILEIIEEGSGGDFDVPDETPAEDFSEIIDLDVASLISITIVSRFLTFLSTSLPLDEQLPKAQVKNVQNLPLFRHWQGIAINPEQKSDMNKNCLRFDI